MQLLYESPHLLKEAHGHAFADFCVHYRYSGIDFLIFLWYQTQSNFYLGEQQETIASSKTTAAAAAKPQSLSNLGERRSQLECIIRNHPMIPLKQQDQFCETQRSNCFLLFTKVEIRLSLIPQEN